MTEPLDQILARRMFSTNRKIRKFFQNNCITVNGVRTTRPETPVNLFRDKILINGERAKLPPDLYIMLNKKAGTLCSKSLSKDDDAYTLIFDHLPQSLCAVPFIPTPLHSVGRLDADTTGLLLLTTNGDFSHRLSVPEFHVEKTYQVTLETPVPLATQKDYIQKCKEGVFCDQQHSSPAFTAKSAKLTFLSESVCHLTITEGKFRQVKRMFQSLGNKVCALHRIRIGELRLDPGLKTGEWRALTELELEAIKN